MGRKRLVATSKQAECRARLQELVAPHLESFNFFVEEGLDASVRNIDPIEIEAPNQPLLRVWFDGCTLGRPTKHDASTDPRLWPHECRESGETYGGVFSGRLAIQIDNRPPEILMRKLGTLPIMLRSKRCHLEKLTPNELVRRKEESTEVGGTFIVNGNEKVIRMLIMQRRHHVCAVIRKAFAKRGPTYSELATSIRCVRDDESSVTVSVHYLTDGNMTMRVGIRKQEFLFPVVLLLKALGSFSDREIFERIVAGRSDVFVTDRVEVLLRRNAKLGLHTSEDALAYLGERLKFVMGVRPTMPDSEVGELFLRKYVFVHLSVNHEKALLLIYMIQKLYDLVQSKIRDDNPDSALFQEVLMSGFLYTAIVKERLMDALEALKTAITRQMRDSRRGRDVSLDDMTFIKRMLDRCEGSFDIGQRMEYFLATGNLATRTGMDLSQVSGYTIIAERINYLRYLAHFRSIHRGAFFSQMKMTGIRKLLPDVWGFMCPVHTPDGTPCGLLNHLSISCKVVTVVHQTTSVVEVLIALGMTPVDDPLCERGSNHVVLLDGRLIGFVDPEEAEYVAASLRHCKVRSLRGVPPTLEIVQIPEVPGGLSPGIFLFSRQSRFIRPVRSLAEGKTEFVGTFEQALMTIAVQPKEIGEHSTHMELDQTAMLSFVANLTPYSDYNQSPRNMYQCQMAKQTMGFPIHAYRHRGEEKVYMLHTPQSPLVKTTTYEDYGIDEYPLGTNAVVAVISYTGYDMEDALILNKASVERGFGHGSVFKTVDVDLGSSKGSPQRDRFCNQLPSGDPIVIDECIDEDGLPYVGARLSKGKPLYVTINILSGRPTIKYYSDLEDAVVDSVLLLGASGKAELFHVRIKLRLPRYPSIGDKFSSRHGQKGVVSVLWPQENMPFSASGLCPDVIINPNAFPSRMTIGMLIESMSGKSAACHAITQDATTFRQKEIGDGNEMLIDSLGKQLVKAGYDYYGNEELFCGTNGELMKMDIFLGVVYYQRLRHMVSDKFQVRAKQGPVNALTRQPVKGRKVGGGIRFGEMERDSLLAHGASFLLQDRLMHCSDGWPVHACKKCGSILTILPESSSLSLGSNTSSGSEPVERGTDFEFEEKSGQGRYVCRKCGVGTVVMITVPFALKYLTSELAAMNVKVSFDIRDYTDKLRVEINGVVLMKIALAGCIHGELDRLYETCMKAQENHGEIDVILCAGDFQAVRNLNDLNYMAVNKRHRRMGDFWQYYAGTKVAPILTIFVGGNHEASNHLRELRYGGWVAPNMFYLGAAGVIQYRGIRIAGIGGIFKDYDFFRNHFETLPLNGPIDFLISHDWPEGIFTYGNADTLFRRKPGLRHDAVARRLGNPHLSTVLLKQHPRFWIAAHHHCLFTAAVGREGGERTDFLALDKVLPNKDFVRVLEVDDRLPSEVDPHLYFDLEWLAVLKATDLYVARHRDPSLGKMQVALPEEGNLQEFEEILKSTRSFVTTRLDGKLKARVPYNFSASVPLFVPGQDGFSSEVHENPQETAFCAFLELTDSLWRPFEELLEWKTTPYDLSSERMIQANSEAVDIGDFSDEEC